MSRLNIVLLRFYVVAALVAGIIAAPLSALFVPVILLLCYAYLWRWPISSVITVLADYFMLFAIPLLLSGWLTSPFAFLTSLPVLYLVSKELESTIRTQEYRDVTHVRTPTNIAIVLFLIAALALFFSLVLGSRVLLFSSAVSIAYLAVLGTVVWRRLPPKPVSEKPLLERILVKSTGHFNIKLKVETRVGGVLFVRSPYEWVKVNPTVFPLKGEEISLAVSLTPLLSGPWSIKLSGLTIDRWGLTRSRCEMEVVRLDVIPRARYASWLAKKYLAESKAGAAPVISDVSIQKPVHMLRRGVEYSSSGQYQPGDSLKNIDWKRSSKYDSLISKRFEEFHAQSAILLTNLCVGDEEEADELGYYFLVTSLSLARESIPTALAVYDHLGVKMTTGELPPRQLVVQALQVVREIVVHADPKRYLKSPDVARLRGDIGRLKSVKSETASRLLQLLQWEYDNLQRSAIHSPATLALNQTFSKAGRDAAVVIISHQNHDAAALAFNIFDLTRKDMGVVAIMGEQLSSRTAPFMTTPGREVLHPEFIPATK